MNKASRIFNDDSSQIISNYFSQVIQCDKVAKALDSYIKTLRLMKESYHRVNSAMLGLSPKGWHQKTKLKICLEDQGEVLSVAEGMVLSLLPRLKSHSRMISDTQTLFSDFERNLQENKSMHEEFERMKKKESLTRQQEEEIRFMLRDTDRALEIISGSVSDRIYKMDESTNTLIKDILMKFQEIQKVIATENLEIIDVMSSLTNTLPKPKARLINLESSLFTKIIDTFKENHDQMKIRQSKAVQQKVIEKHPIEVEPTKRQEVAKDKMTQEIASSDQRLEVIEDESTKVEPTKRQEVAKIKTTQEIASSDQRLEVIEEESTSPPAISHQAPIVAHDPNEQPTTSKVHNFETEIEYGESGRRSRSEKKPMKKAFYGYRSTL